VSLKGRVSDLQKHCSCVWAAQMPTTFGAGVRQAPEDRAAWSAPSERGRLDEDPLNEPD
jgi:hypothetical protein